MKSIRFTEQTAAVKKAKEEYEKAARQFAKTPSATNWVALEKRMATYQEEYGFLQTMREGAKFHGYA